MLGTGQILNQGRYRIISSSDEGPLGRTYEAYDTVNTVNVVLSERVGITGKVVSASQVEAVHAAFTEQAKVLSALHHEALIRVHDYFTELDRQYLVCESVTGNSLAKYLESVEKQPELTEVLSWADEVLSVLHYLHRLSPPVIHGDIRPENIKLTSDLKVKLMMPKVSPFSSASQRNHGKDPAVNFKPLEQLWPDLDGDMQKAILEAHDERSAGLLLRPLDARSDIYSTGATLYQVLTGSLPVDSLERSVTILNGRPDPLPRPCDLNPTIPPEISDVLMRAMSLRREDRFDWAVIMSQALRTAKILANEGKAEVKQMPKDGPNTIKETTVDIFPMRTGRESDVDPTTPEAHLELRQQLAADRLSELEAEQARLEEERNKIEQRRLELEAEKARHAAERERLLQEAKEARRRAEQERKRLERERIEKETELERQKIAERIAALEADRERERVEQARLEAEAEAERQRAERRLQELQAEQARRRAEQERIEHEAKKELELVELRLLKISGADTDISEPDDDRAAAPQEQASRPETEIIEKVFDRSPSVSDEIAVPDFGGRSSRNWHTPIVGGAAILIVGAVVAWLVMQPADSPVPIGAVTQSAVGPPETPLVSIEPSPAEDLTSTKPSPVPEQILVSPQNDTTSVPSEAAASDQKRIQISAVPEKQKKPASEKPPAAKKRVTVDDLINDN